MHEVSAALDRAGHQLGEKGNEQGIPQKISLCRNLPPMDIKKVAQGLKGIEGDEASP